MRRRELGPGGAGGVYDPREEKGTGNKIGIRKKLLEHFSFFFLRKEKFIQKLFFIVLNKLRLYKIKHLTINF